MKTGTLATQANTIQPGFTPRLPLAVESMLE